MSTELRPTPEVDNAKGRAYEYGPDLHVVSADFARSLERQRDEARAALKRSCDDEHRLTEEVAMLTVQRDKLLAALVELRDWYQNFTGLPACNANAAAAAVEGGGK